MTNSEQKYNEILEKINEKIAENEKKNNQSIEIIKGQISENDIKNNKNIEILKGQISGNEIKNSKNIETIKVQIANNEKKTNKKLDKLNNKIEDLNVKQEIEPEIFENNENKIINLGRFFNNKRINEKVFSINEPIRFEDLEKLAIEVIDLSNEDTAYNIDLAK